LHRGKTHALLDNQPRTFSLLNNYLRRSGTPPGDTNLRAEPEPPLDPVLSLRVNREPPSDT